MKKSVVKAVSLCLCGALAIGCAGVRALASGNEKAEEAKPALLASGTTVSASRPSSTDETVYVLAGADGSVEKVIVSDWLKNAGGAPALSDDAKLDGVENVKGNESFTLSGDTRIWDARGGDIYTQGTTDQDLPVDMTIRYTLDGKAVTPEELAGKSGRVTIRFDYANHAYRLMDIGGKQEKIYVPFVMLTGMALDNEVFQNVEVSNGRVYNDGGRTAVIGMAFPGLQENLGVDPEKLEIPSYVEVTADVTGFELTTTFTVAVSDIFGQLDTDRLDETNDLNESLGKLTDAMDQLMDGADRLHDGLNTLLEKSGELVSGIDKLAAGAGSLKDGADALETGAAQLQTGADALSEGMDTLSAGLDTLNGNSAALDAGSKQVFDTLLASASQQLAAAGVKLPAELTAENYGKILDGVIAAMPEAASAPVVRLKDSLDSYNQFYQGLRTYTAGVAQAASGAGELKAGAAQLSSGAAQLNTGAAQLSGGAALLYGGIETLQSSAPALVDGVTQLRDGSKDLADGLDEFNRDGVQKLVDAVDGDLEGLVERLQATADASRSYQSFSGISQETEGQVKFIYRTAPVGDAA